MNRADMRNYRIERENTNRGYAGEDLLVRFFTVARSSVAQLFASAKVRIIAACFGFIAFLVGTIGFAAGVDNGSISFVYVIPFLAALLGVSFVMLSRGEDNRE